MTETHSRKRLIGYARASTLGQTLDSQLQPLRAAGVQHRNIHKEKVTGGWPDRRELPADARPACSRRRGDGDAYRPARAQHLRPVRHRQAHRPREGARFRSLGEPRADTGTSAGRLTAAVPGGRADVEPDLIRTRTAED
jgi:DNA invertase Pin-like site-specific DNA recombinase